MKYKILKNCNDCEFLLTDRVYKEDPWDDCDMWTCTKKNKIISIEVEPFDDPDIPEWCPLPDLPEPTYPLKKFKSKKSKL